MPNKNSIDQSELRTPPVGFDKFMNGTVWFDMNNLIKERLEYLQNLMLQSTDFEEMRNLQGQMTAWKEMLGMPSYLKECAHKETHVNQKDLDL